MLTEKEKHGNIRRKQLTTLEMCEKMSSQDIKAHFFFSKEIKKKRPDKALYCLRWIVLAERVHMTSFCII